MKKDLARLKVDRNERTVQDTVSYQVLGCHTYATSGTRESANERSVEGAVLTER
jgi:hypothetical protein